MLPPFPGRRLAAVRRLAFVALMAAGMLGRPAGAGAADYGYRVVHGYPHDTHAFTEGLFYLSGFLYEATGLEGQSSIRKERLETGEVIQRRAIPSQYFGEGIVAWGDRLIELTWQSHVAFIYDLATFKSLGEFHYPGEGWALTRNARHLIMSDGTPYLRLLNPETFEEVGRIEVTDAGVPVANLNELEWVRGRIYANIWQTNRIVEIDPATGKVVGHIDLTGLLDGSGFSPGPDDVLNGIAYDSARDRLFVTGKNWPKVFEIKLVPKAARP
jgi:glutamine cyclotransferase